MVEAGNNKPELKAVRGTYEAADSMLKAVQAHVRGTMRFRGEVEMAEKRGRGDLRVELRRESRADKPAEGVHIILTTKRGDRWLLMQGTVLPGDRVIDPEVVGSEGIKLPIFNPRKVSSTAKRLVKANINWYQPF